VCEEEEEEEEERKTRRSKAQELDTKTIQRIR
jgi:hypothetical protein